MFLKRVDGPRQVALPDGSGRHVFATTFAEHEENVRRYLGGG